MSDDYLIESREVNGFTVNVKGDPYPSDTENPRDWDGSFRWLGFPHRNYKIGDEQINPETFETECVICHGSGRVEVIEANAEFPCAVCNGYGTETAGDLAGLIALVKRHYRARIVMPVGMYDHSGVSYYLGANNPCPWDSGTCGLMLVTQEMLDEWGNTQTDEELIEGMKAEIQLYSDWVNGDVCYVEVLDSNGDDVGTVHGFIGDAGRRDAMSEGVAIADASTLPEPLYAVPRLTAEEIATVRTALEFCITPASVREKFANIIVKEPA